MISQQIIDKNNMDKPALRKMTQSLSHMMMMLRTGISRDEHIG